MSEAGALAIVGLGVTRQGVRSGVPERLLRREALEAALDDAGLQRSEIDGYIACHGNTAFEDLRFLGLAPNFSWSLTSGGATAISALVVARGVIATGQARCVALNYGFAPSQMPGGVGGHSYGYPQLFGMFGPAASHALHATRHMHLYGTTSEQLGAVAVQQRSYASRRPGALGFEKPFTLEDHQSSRMIAEPLRLLDCCRDTDGGVCVLVTSAERARDLDTQPRSVEILGLGTGHNIRNWNDKTVYAKHDDVEPAARRAFAEAGIGLEDVDVAELYDPFTISVIMQLEHYGFCKAGEGGPFVASGATGPDGAIPTNTGGGQLSAWYATGFTPLAEAIWQLRGEAGATQIPDARVALVSGHGGNGGVQNTWAHATALLGSTA
ncbi:MAG: thiolase family protein [Deltaproteobacteria bacterium]|nr:thiolase family protein [Deltaproteobacteria bacterium]